MNILVTGGAGFIGTNLIKKLVQLKHNVTSIDNYSTGVKTNHQVGCKYVDADITEIENLDKFKPDLVYHLAAIARIQPSFDSPKDYFKVNANGTLNLVHWCAKNNIPCIYAGSSSTHSGKFKNPYTFSKDIGEEVIKLYQEHYGLNATITRFYNVYGPYQLLQGGYRTLIGIWLDAYQNNKEFIIYGDGEQKRDFTHVDDIIDALILIMQKKAYNYVFELGLGSNLTINEVLSYFGKSAKIEPPRKGEARNTLNTDMLAKTILNWDPKIQLFDYLKIELKKLKS
jgi:UDP-glucose 4-epimerase